MGGGGECYQAGDTGPLDHAEAVEGGFGFEEVDGETPGQVRSEEGAEKDSLRVRAFTPEPEDQRECGKEDDLVELSGVAWNAVAEVDGPGEGCWFAVCVVGEAGQEAADAADGDAEAEWQGEEVSGAGANAGEGLGDLDGKPTAEQAADDGLAAGQQKSAPGELRERYLFEQAERAGAEQRSDGRGGDDDPAMVVVYDIAGAAAETPVEEIAGDIAEGFKYGVQLRMRCESQVGQLYGDGGQGGWIGRYTFG